MSYEDMLWREHDKTVRENKLKRERELNEKIAQSIEWLCPNCKTRCHVELNYDHIRAECQSCNYYDTYGG